MDKLDNPSWYSLSETHEGFAVDYNDIKFYHPDYCPFGGFTNPVGTEKGISLDARLTNNFFVVGDKPKFNDQVRLNNELVCHQMVLSERINLQVDEDIIELRTQIHKADLFSLVNLVQPGYFRDRTSRPGKILWHLQG